MRSPTTARLAQQLLLLLVLVTGASAYSVSLNSWDPTVCTGVLAGSWLKMRIANDAAKAETPMMLSVLVYEMSDEKRFVDPDTGRASLCGPGKYCAGQFIVQDTVPFIYPYLNKPFIFNDTHQASIWRNSFDFPSTGLYCVAVESSDPDQLKSLEFDLKLSFEAPYGKLPGADFPKLGLFLGLSITYLVIGALWFVRSWMFWREILQLQHYLSGVTFFLMVEMAFNYGYYEDFNLNGEPHIFMLVMVIILNAARNSISFFMLLIVSLGYGVVKPTLGTNMKKCVILGVIHFLAGVLYGAGALVINDVSPGLALLFSLPLSFAMTVFYYSILNGLTDTMENLAARRQPIKLLMYQRLWRILVFSAAVLVVFFVVNTIAFKNRMDPEWLPIYWQYRWLLLDGWLNILYLVIYLSIALLWRPTENNQRYGLEQLAGDDYEDDEPIVPGGPGLTNPTQRKIHLRTMHTAHTDDTLEDLGDEFEDDGEGNEEDDDDVFRWAEENAGGRGEAGGSGLDASRRSAEGGGGSGGLARDSSRAGLLDVQSERLGAHKMA
ncbi:hypothetical protein CcCBS67573_g09584 [Chytriomyces confervae]|uniref:GOST seven transmembrane domain-containing protein n=1 Tax=Chytriomyces confervae TaxID=246404 RepID=A0A507DRL7_9FUNG|nr:hypothetical protein CcCBS67573_g09584 [Chytriomyces confervae]